MSTRIPPSLSWLIDKRARLDAEVRKTRKALLVAKDLLQELSELEDSLAAIDKTLSLHEISVNVDLISPINSKYLRLNLPRGELTKSILLFLRLKSEEGPVGVFAIRDFIEIRHPNLLGGLITRRKLTRSIHTCLDRLRRQGLLLRHHDPNKNLEGKWTLANFHEEEISSQ